MCWSGTEGGCGGGGVHSRQATACLLHGLLLGLGWTSAALRLRPHEAEVSAQTLI